MAIILRLNPLRICPRSIFSVAFAMLFCGIGLSAETVGKMSVPQILSEFDNEGVAELPLLKLLRIEYFEPNYDFSVLIRIFNSWRLKSRQI